MFFQLSLSSSKKMFFLDRFEMATEINSNTSPIVNEKIDENLEDDFQR